MRKFRRGLLKASAAVLTGLCLAACGFLSPDQDRKAEKEQDIHEALCEEYRDVVPDYVLTYAENQPYDYPTVQGACYFARQVHEKSRGRIQIRIYSNAELGAEENVISQMSFGGCDFMRASIATLAAYNDQCNVLMLPYLYTSSDHMWSVLQGDVGQEIISSFDDTDMVPLAWYDAGVRNFYSRIPMEKAEDLSGRRIRVQDSDLMQDLVRALGAVPATSVFNDVYGLLETGAVDAAENNWNSYESMEHYKVAPYYIIDEHTRIPELVLMSRVTARRMTEEDMEIIRECAIESTECEREAWEEQEKLSRTKLLKQNVQVITFPDEEKEKLRRMAEPLYEKYCGDYMDLVDRIRRAGQ